MIFTQTTGGLSVIIPYNYSPCVKCQYNRDFFFFWLCGIWGGKCCAKCNQGIHLLFWADLFSVSLLFLIWLSRWMGHNIFHWLTLGLLRSCWCKYELILIYILNLRLFNNLWGFVMTGICSLYLWVFGLIEPVLCNVQFCCAVVHRFCLGDMFFPFLLPFASPVMFYMME